MVPKGKSVPFAEQGHFVAMRNARDVRTHCVLSKPLFFASELTHFRKHLTSRSSRSLTLTRTPSTPHQLRMPSALSRSGRSALGAA